MTPLLFDPNDSRGYLASILANQGRQATREAMQLLKEGKEAYEQQEGEPLPFASIKERIENLGATPDNQSIGTFALGWSLGQFGAQPIESAPPPLTLVRRSAPATTPPPPERRRPRWPLVAAALVAMLGGAFGTYAWVNHDPANLSPAHARKVLESAPDSSARASAVNAVLQQVLKDVAKLERTASGDPDPAIRDRAKRAIKRVIQQCEKAR